MCVELEMPIKGSPWVWCDIPLRALHRAPQVSQSPKLSFLLPHFTPNLLVLPPFYPLLFSLVLSALLLSMVQTSYAHTFWCSLLSNCRWETSFNILAVSQSIRVHHQHQFGGVCVGFAYRLVAVVKCDPCFLVVEAPFSKQLPSHFCSHFALQHLSIFVSIMQFMLALITLWSWLSAITFEDFFLGFCFAAVNLGEIQSGYLAGCSIMLPAFHCACGALICVSLSLAATFSINVWSVILNLFGLYQVPDVC